MVQVRLEKNALYLLAASCVTNLSLFLVNIILINRLSKTDFGIFTLMVSLIYMYIVFSELGISQGTIKYISEYNALGNIEYIKSHIKSFFSATLIISLLFLILFYLSIPLWRNFYDILPINYAVLFALSIIPYPLVRYWNAITDGFQSMKYALLFSLVREPIKLLCLVFVIFVFSIDLQKTVIVFIVASYITLLCSYIIYRNFTAKKDIHIEIGIERSVLLNRVKIKYFSYLYMAFLIFWIQPNILFLIIGRFLSPQDIAVFTACYILNNIMWVFLLPIMDTLYPFISSISTNKGMFISAQKKINIVLFIVITYSFLWVIAVYFFGEKMISFLYGNLYAAHQNILYLLSISLFFDCFRVLFDPILKGTKYANILLCLELARLIGLIVIGPLSIVKGGLIYFCYLMILLSLIVNFLKSYFLSRYFSLNLIWSYCYALALLMLVCFL